MLYGLYLYIRFVVKAFFCIWILNMYTDVCMIVYTQNSEVIFLYLLTCLFHKDFSSLIRINCS